MAIAEISALVAGIKTTVDIITNLQSSHDSATILQAQTDVLEHLFTIKAEALTLQEKHLAIIHEKDELIKKIAQFEQWAKTESEYELQDIGDGTFVYTSKNSQESGVPTHWLCTQCWDDRKKSILQRQRPRCASKLVCPRCGFEFRE